MKEELHIRYTIEQNQDRELDAVLKACVKKHGWYWCSTSFNYATGERGLDFDREEPTGKGSGTLEVRMPGDVGLCVGPC